MEEHDTQQTPTHETRGAGKRVAIGVVALVAALIAVFVFRLIFNHREDANLNAAAGESVEAPSAVEVMRVQRAPSHTTLSLPGETKAFNETTIYARTSGYLNKWLVDIGDKVKAGDVLAVIDTPELDDQLAAAQAKVRQQKSEVDLAQAGVKFAQLSFNRWELAAPEGAVSKQERDQKKSELDTGTAKLETANAQLAVADAEIRRLNTLASFKNVVAPFDGTITQRQVDIGDLVTAGSSASTTPLFSVARVDKVRVFVDVPQSASPEIKVGMKATVTADEYNDKKFEGEVDRTADVIDPSARTLRVEVLVPNPDLLLKAGMYVHVDFKTDRFNPPLEVPAGALVIRPQGPQVAVVSAQGEVKFHDVKIGFDMGDRIEISSGLAEGELAALNIGSDVEDGQKVAIHLTEPVADKPQEKPSTPTERKTGVAAEKDKPPMSAMPATIPTLIGTATSRAAVDSSSHDTAPSVH